MYLQPGVYNPAFLTGQHGTTTSKMPHGDEVGPGILLRQFEVSCKICRWVAEGQRFGGKFFQWGRLRLGPDA